MIYRHYDVLEASAILSV